MKNQITAGQARLGWLVDGDPDTPGIPATLELVDGRVRLSVSWSRDEETAGVDQWFAHVRPGATSASMMPENLAFSDQHGLVHLVGVYASGLTLDPISGLGTGRIEAQYVVPDGFAMVDSFEVVSLLRTSISGLVSWMGRRHLQESAAHSDGDLAYTFTAPAPRPIPIPQTPGLELVCAVVVGRDNVEQSVTLREEVYVVTTPEAATPWSEQLGVHLAIRDLVALSSWRTQHVAKLEAKPDGSEDERAAWRSVHAPGVIREVRPRRQAAYHVLGYGDLGPEGVGAWISLRQTYERALDPLLSILLRESVTVDNALTYAGISLEALGYALSLERDLPGAAGMNFAARLRLIGQPLEPVLGFDVEEWVAGTVEAYNGLKHANRALPDPQEVSWRARQCIQVMRAWVGTELGLDPDTLAGRLRVSGLTSRRDGAPS